ncbi:MAG: hypothetical protein ACOC3C_01855 [Candidatus Thorarchaeota archaeon]
MLSFALCSFDMDPFGTPIEEDNDVQFNPTGTSRFSARFTRELTQAEIELLETQGLRSTTTTTTTDTNTTTTETTTTATTGTTTVTTEVPDIMDYLRDSIYLVRGTAILVLIIIIYLVRRR